MALELIEVKFGQQFLIHILVYGRDIVEAHYRACIYAGVQISGINAGKFLKKNLV